MHASKTNEIPLERSCKRCCGIISSLFVSFLFFEVFRIVTICCLPLLALWGGIKGHMSLLEQLEAKTQDKKRDPSLSSPAPSPPSARSCVSLCVALSLAPLLRLVVPLSLSLSSMSCCCCFSIYIYSQFLACCLCPSAKP